MGIQLTEKEQELLVLCIVKECIAYAEKNNKTFEDVLNEDLFPAEANTGFAEMVCKTIEALKNKGCIDGTVVLKYEIKLELDADSDTFEEESTDAIDFSSCIFENINISAKGNIRLGTEGFKEVSKEFGKKALPIVKCIATTTLQTCVESAVVLGLRTVGIPV
jgi:hypothetical protein